MDNAYTRYVVDYEEKSWCDDSYIHRVEAFLNKADCEKWYWYIKNRVMCRNIFTYRARIVPDESTSLSE